MATHADDADSTRRVDNASFRPALAAGSRVFGRFVLEAKLGNGGMGEVWRASDEKLSERVALKFLLTAIAADAVAVDELKEETLRARRLTHPNIVRIHEFYQDEQNSAIAMELVEGTTMAKLRLEQPEKIFSAQVLAPFVVQVCGALDYAHRQAKVAHRDIKPSNIFISPDGVAKLGDFGIARNLAETQARKTLLNAPQGTIGTLSYMSPQQIAGDPPSAADDIYSLGAALYEMLTSKPPFYRGSDATLIIQIREKTPLSIAAQRKEQQIVGQAILQEWEETIMACLAKDPAQRPATASDVAFRLTRALEKSPPAGAKSGAFFKFLSAFTATALIAAGFFLIWYFYFSDYAQAEAEKPKIVSAPATRTKEPRLADSGAAPVPSPAAPHVSTANGPTPQTVKENPVTTNSLGLVLIPLSPGRSMSATLIRRADFARFVASANPPTPRFLVTVGPEGWLETAGSWRNPGFAQGDDHPVVGVSWLDAQAFCHWLTGEELKARNLSGKQHYRLPTESEWKQAASRTNGIYPWGSSWPPLTRSGNFAGQEVSTAGLSWPEDWSTIADYADEYPRTSPVGAFGKNANGFADLAGNALQWCEGAYSSDSPNKVLRGSSWADSQPAHLRLDARQGDAPDFRSTTVGFRIVLETAESAQKE